MKKLILILVSICLLTLVSCARATDHPSSNLTPVRILLDWTPNSNHAGLYVASVLGYYQNQGLEVSIIQASEEGGLELLAAGKVDFTISFQESLASALAADEPLPVTAVAGITAHNTSGIISLKQTGILRPKDMMNHTYATWGDPIEKAILEEVMTRDGGDYQTLKIIPSTVTDVLSALQTDIDCVWVYYGVDGVAAEVKGLDTHFFYFKDIVPELDFYTPLIASNDAFLKKHPDTAQKFLAATTEGYEYAILHPEETAQIMCEAVPELDFELTLASQIYYAPQYKAAEKRWGFIKAERWNGFYDWLDSKDLLHQAIPRDTGYSNDYLPKGG